MKIFYSAALNRKDKLERNNIKNILISIHGVSNIEKQIEKNEWMLQGDLNLMIDNGAFSAWNSGKEIISVQDYTEFCLKFYDRFKDRFKNIYFIGLDDIPGERNSKPTVKQVEYSCKTTFENFQYMLSKGVKNVLPVVHQFEDPKWLKKYEEYTDFVCLSPANDQSNKSRANWLTEMYSIINPTTKTHGLAVTGKYLVERFPWYSVDSISWLAPESYGRVYYWKFYTLLAALSKDLTMKMDMDTFEIFLCTFNNELTSQQKAEILLDYHVEALKKLEFYITELWKKRGIIWNEEL